MSATEAPPGEPDIARLTALLQATELVIVVDGSGFDPRRRKASRVLGRAGDTCALAALRRALRCLPSAERRALMTPGEPTIGCRSGIRQ